MSKSVVDAGDGRERGIERSRDRGWAVAVWWDLARSGKIGIAGKVIRGGVMLGWGVAQEGEQCSRVGALLGE
jgi:hypothetical protein